MLKKYRATFRDLGGMSALVYGAGRLFGMVSNDMWVYRYALVAQRVSDLPTLPLRRGKSIEVKEISAVDPILTDLTPDLSEKVLQFRKDQNAVCLAAFMKGEIIGCIWLCFGAYSEDEVRCRFSPISEEGASWDFGLYIKPEHRNSVAFSRIWHSTKKYLTNRGVYWSFSRISSFNTHSIKSHKRAGAIAIGNVTFVRAGVYQLTFSRMRPFLHFSRNVDSMPHFILCAPDDRFQKGYGPDKIVSNS